MEWNEFIGLIALLYAVSDPISVIPMFLNITSRLKNKEATKIVFVSACTVAILLSFAVILGDSILKFFHVSLDDFRIAGGLLMLHIAFNMFQAKHTGITQTNEEIKEAENNVSTIAVTPLAFPLLVGPAAFSIMITLSSSVYTWIDKGWLIIVSLITSVLIALTLFMSTPLLKIMGNTGVNITTRLMALIVAAIAINFIVAGVKNHFG